MKIDFKDVLFVIGLSMIGLGVWFQFSPWMASISIGSVLSFIAYRKA